MGQGDNEIHNNSTSVVLDDSAGPATENMVPYEPVLGEGSYNYSFDPNATDSAMASALDMTDPAMFTEPEGPPPGDVSGGPGTDVAWEDVAWKDISVPSGTEHANHHQWTLGTAIRQ